MNKVQSSPASTATCQNPPAPVSARSAPGSSLGIWLRFLIGFFLLMLLLGSALGLYWSRQPVVAEIPTLLDQRLGEASSGQALPGMAFVATMLFVGDTLLHKPGGFLHNDRLPPGSLMDNMPSWECGVIMALRDATQALRNDFTRAQSQSREELNVKRADLQFAINPKSWMMPAAEEEYRKGLVALEAYFDALANQQTDHAERFFPRADNLTAYLALVEKRLGNFSVRLSHSVSNAGLSAVLEPGRASQGNPVGPDSDPDLDEVFYCARGYSWTLLHLMRAIERDFAAVLAGKNADASLRQIIVDLRGATKPMHSPMVMNGSGYGLIANHSLVIASYISRVNAAIIDLKLLLLQG